MATRAHSQSDTAGTGGGKFRHYGATTVLGVAAAAATVVLAYSESSPVALFSALAVLAVCAWRQDAKFNLAAYLVTLGVQIPLPRTALDLPFRIAIADFFLLPLIATWGWAVYRGQSRVKGSALAGPLLALTGVMAVGIVVGIARTGNLTAYVLFNKAAGFLFLTLGFFAISHQLRTRADLHRAVGIFVLAASCVNVLALLAAALSVTIAPNPVFQVENGRLYGWMLNPSSYGAFIVTVAMLELASLAGHPERQRWRLLRMVNYVFLLVSVGLTVSRSAWLALAVGAAIVTVTSVMSSHRDRYRMRLVIAAATATLAVAPVVWVVVQQWNSLVRIGQVDPSGSQSLQQRLAEGCVYKWDPDICSQVPAKLIESARATAAARPLVERAAGNGLSDPDGAVSNTRGLEDRATIVRAAWDAYTASNVTRLLGIGVGTFYATSAAPFGLPVIIHNTALWFLVEMGPVGLVVLMWLLGRTLANLRRARRHAGWERELADGLIAALGGWIVFSMFNEAFYLRHFWLMLLFADRLFDLSVGRDFVDATLGRPKWFRHRS